MNDDLWTALPDQAGAGELWEHVETLVSWDGPGVVVARLGGRLVLAVLADESDDDLTQRWVAAPISRTGADALRRGVSSLRTPFSGPTGWVVDLDTRESRVSRQWSVAPSDLGDAVLPTYDAYLERVPLEPVRETTVVLDTVGRFRGVTTEALGEFLLTQAACNDLFADDPVRQTVVLARAGSLELVIESDGPEFDLIQRELSRFVSSAARRAPSDIHAPKEILAYLTALARHQLDVSIRTPTAEYFHGVGEAYRALAADGQRPERPEKTDYFTIPGYFQRYDEKNLKFSFMRSDTGRTIVGTVEMAETPTITVGGGILYRASFEKTTTIGRPRYVLTDADPINFELVVQEQKDDPE